MPHKIAAVVSACLLLTLGTAAAAAVTSSASTGRDCGGKTCNRKRPVPTSTTTTTTTAATTTTASQGGLAAASQSIYWGAYIEGTQTYGYLYGGSWGNAPWDARTWDRFEANAGKRVSIEHYGQPAPWEQAFAAGPADAVTARGAVPMIDMSSKSVALTQVASGAYDASLAAWARAVRSWGKPFLLRWNWEMNGTWFAWGAQAKQDPAAFVAAWRHFHDVVDREGAANVTWVWCPNVEFTGSTPYERLYPGDAYVDWTCLDGYNQGASSVGFATLFGQSYDHLVALAPSKPVMIGETGSKEYAAGVKAAWITDAFGRLPARFPQVKAVVWFNWRIYEGGAYKEWEIESSPSAQSAFATAVAGRYFAPGGSFVPPGPLTKVRPLP